MKAEAGASATLSCEVAQAQTEVTWFKDGKKLSSSSKVRVEASGCSRRLVVQQAGKADAGEYSCEAGGQKLSFRLDVAGQLFEGTLVAHLDEMMNNLRTLVLLQGTYSPRALNLLHSVFKSMAWLCEQKLMQLSQES